MSSTYFVELRRISRQTKDFSSKLCLSSFAIHLRNLIDFFYTQPGDARNDDVVAADFFVVPTVFFELLFVFVILSHDRRRVVHFGVTAHPAAEGAARQLLGAFPWDSAPRDLLRDWDGSYGERFREAANWLGIRGVLTAPQSPWQNAYVERWIGSIRHACLDPVILLNEATLRRVRKSYFEYYERSRTQLSPGKDAPISRPIGPRATGRVVEIPQVGGLHHRYERVAA